MPMIDVKIFEDRLTTPTSAELITRLTDAVVEVYGEDIRPSTWITLTPYPRQRWGIGGTTTSSAGTEKDEGSPSPTN